MNGILYDITNSEKWAAAGGSYKYDSAFSSDIGGYPKGAVLLKSTLSGFWQSTTENNVTNPDAGGAGWLDISSGRLINVRTFLSSGTYTPTPGTASVIVEVQAAGGSGSGCSAAGSGQASLGGGGGAGAYSKHRLTTGFSGVAITVGTGGVSGSSGGNSSFGSLVVCSGGAGGPTQGLAPLFPYAAPGATGGSAPSVGNIIKARGATGGFAFITDSLGSITISGAGGNSQLGAGGGNTGNGNPGIQGGIGAGGSGVCNSGPSAARNGGQGGNGMVIVWEYS
ncbi:glycine-rich domain-containing protein [Serratia proteamaculans]